jgi:N-acetylglucosaminyldiphosphoundecaprenol N-acetyl-beta-D-mannosaminyltransferase
VKKITIFTIHTDTGGIERYVASLARMFSGEYNVEIIATYNNGEPPAFELPEGVGLRYLIDGTMRNASIKDLLRRGRADKVVAEVLGRMWMTRKKYVRNARAVRECNADIIITERPFFSRVVGRHCKKRDVLKIATEHNFHQDNSRYIRKVVKSVRGFDYLIVATGELQKFYEPLVKPVKCVKIINHLPNIPSKKSELSGNNIVAVGRFAPEKGFLDLLEVMRLVHEKKPDVKLYLLGDGEEDKKISAKISELGLGDVVVAPGIVAYDDLCKYFYDSSLYVMTSHTECFGLVLVEAMSHGLPCIAFDSASGARELITKDVGVLVKGRDKEAMAGEIASLLGDKKRLKKYQGEINKYVSGFSEDVVKKGWKKILGS